ncbi:MAG: hypothetical protein SCARUB_04204 [Candidatus Scalindua rubra]|uniref:Ribosomal silencing factor RsfS n=1 Tax=Candidatus Scalindua rubra TaxID=1872076 RepID=A0A1E3X4S5_9BACT|nr:MAG: hypothetical protein SCARUB_04204 [Candidatus Scalindua rubra]
MSKAESIYKISFFIIVSSNDVASSTVSKRQLYTIADEIEKELKKLSIEKLGMEGYREAKWILMDYGDVIVHLFGKEMRSYYDL